MGAQSEIGYNSTPKWLNSTPKWLSSDDFIEEGVGEGVLWPIIPTLRITYVYDQSLTTASENRLFGSVVDHWTFDPVAQVQIPPKSLNFFSA